VDNKHTGTRSAQILVVEDNDSDVELLRAALERSTLPFTLHCACDGVDCMAFLRKEGRYAEMPTPELILLDLNMPRKNGRETLIEIMADETLRSLPVIVLSTSLDEEEILQLYQLGCRSYIVKPEGFSQFSEAIRSLAEYWFKAVTLPPKISKRQTTRLGA